MYLQWLLGVFNDMLVDTGLKNMELSGHQYTWKNWRDTEAWMEIGLDRALANNSRFYLYPLAKLYNLEGSPSDHSLIFQDPKKNNCRTGK